MSLIINAPNTWIENVNVPRRDYDLHVPKECRHILGSSTGHVSTAWDVGTSAEYIEGFADELKEYGVRGNWYPQE